MIPFGKGRQHLGSAPGMVDAVVGGWNLQTIGTFASGTYFSPSFTGTNPSNTNTSGGLPDCLADGNLPNGTRTWNRWFDASAFAIPQPGHFGNCGGNTLVGPGIYVMHASLSKDFHITERSQGYFDRAVFEPVQSSQPGIRHAADSQYRHQPAEPRPVHF